MMSNEFEKALDAFLEGADADEAHQALYDVIRAAFLAGWRSAGGDPPQEQKLFEFVLGGKDADLIYKHLNREAYAEDVLKQYGAEITPYGMVNRADFGPLNEPIPEQQQEQMQEPQMGM